MISFMAKQTDQRRCNGEAEMDVANIYLPETIDEETSESEIGDESGRELVVGDENNGDAQLEIAGKENQLVKYSKFLVVVVIFCVAAVIGYFTHSYVSKQEKEERKRQFANVANDIIFSSEVRTRGIFENLESVSVSLTNNALSMNASWPFVTFPNFQVTGMVSNGITGAYTISVAPLVIHELRDAYVEYALRNQWWLDEGHMYDNEVAEDIYVEQRFYDEPAVERRRHNETTIYPVIWAPAERGPKIAQDSEYYFPISQVAPAEDFTSFANLDVLQIPGSDTHVNALLAWKKPVLTSTTRIPYLQESYDRRFSRLQDAIPHTYIYHPIFDGFKKGRKIVGLLSVFLSWDEFFKDILPQSERPIHLVVEGSCPVMGEFSALVITFKISGRNVEFVGEGDLHATEFTEMEKAFEFAPFSRLEPVEGGESCSYITRMYPTAEYNDQFFSSDPFVFAIAVVTCFLATTLVFLIYDTLVSLRQKKVMESAKKTNAIISGLFPSNVRERLMEEFSPETKPEPKMQREKNRWFSTRQLKTTDSRFDMSMNNMNYDFSENESSAKGVDTCDTSETIFGSKPIADLFPAVTILFGDMVGFTAWSSVREPKHVFTLLETVYHSFDMIAKRRHVFKVETIGDCYVACAGLPTQTKDHAIIMCRFANEILHKMTELVAGLETSLGPDTADLCLRIGLHSGPCTAGVLRGEKGRFQLFGDTMNTTARIESTGAPNRIHISRETAECLQLQGKGRWVIQREEKVHAKGKGELQTYWLQIQPQSQLSSHAISTNKSEGEVDSESNMKEAGNSLPITSGHYADNSRTKMNRLVAWNVELLAGLLRQIMAQRASRPVKPVAAQSLCQNGIITKHGNVLNEVVDILPLPQFDETMFINSVDPSTIEISQKVMNQLTNFVRQIATMYKKHSFHNFEHASHVTMSVHKLLSRVTTPNEISKAPNASDQKVASDLHDQTFGITSDPMTQFSVVLSALIHDVDHPGVPNSALVKEQDPLAIKYGRRSIAEQHSVDVAWEILMSPQYKDLQNCIWQNKEELVRLRQLIVNMVMATDIMDKKLKALRNARWVKAFKAVEEDSDDSSNGSNVCNVNRRATIVLEHLIQASDVSHTMQHWHVFRKWNERLFCEMYQAFLDGCTDSDPSENWYKGEIGFFDFYIIPLAKKLGTCGVFGASSHEYLSYAEANRREWTEKGQDIVKEYMRKVQSMARVSKNENDEPSENSVEHGLPAKIVPNSDGSETRHI